MAIPTDKPDAVISADLEFRSAPSRTLLSLVARPEPVWMDVLGRSGAVLRSYRIIPKAGKGLLLWPLIESNLDLLRAYQHASGPSDTQRHAHADDKNRDASVRAIDAAAIRFRTLHPGLPFSHSSIQLSSGCPLR